MAEVAAGALVAEQIVSTSVEVGGIYALGRPSNGLKASFNQFATTSADGTSNSLVRSHHSLTVVQGRAYIFGGQTNDERVASNDIHSFALPNQRKEQSDYHLSPALPTTNGGPVPAPRMSHSACALGDRIAVYGGLDESGKTIQDPTIWLHDPQTAQWDAIVPAASATVPRARSAAKLFSHGNNLLLYGGEDSEGNLLQDVWLFEASTETWARLPDAPIATPNAAATGSSLYLISATDPLGGTLYHLSITVGANDEPATWDSAPFPTNPLAPGPRPRENGGLLHINTGLGRSYLLYFFGNRQSSGNRSESSPTKDTATPTQWSDMWTLQLPGGETETQRRGSISEAIKPANIKDTIRSKLGFDTGTLAWAEVELKPPGDLLETEGKVHPGPRSLFGCDVLANGKDIALWGGSNAKGEKEGDGWLIQLE